MAVDNSKVKIISESFIRPKSQIEHSKNPHYLSTNDLYQLSTSYMHRGLLYPKPSPSTQSFDIYSFVDKLSDSLSIALVHFYPLAGRLETIKYEDEHACWIYVDCNKGHGAKLIHASALDGVTISDITSSDVSVPRYLWCFFDAGELGVVNYDGHTRALLTVQVTELVDGVFIGFTMNHSLADGTSLWSFITALSAIHMLQDQVILHPPIFEPVFADGYGPVIKLPYLNPDEFITRLDVDPRLRVRAFSFSAVSIAKLKAQANKDSESLTNIDNEINNTISSFQALAAFMWLTIARARQLPVESNLGCWLTADARPKFRPTLSSNHFGNFVKLAMSTAKVKDLTNNGLGWAAMQLHKAVMGLDDKSIRSALKASAESPQVAQLQKLKYVNYPLIFTGSMKFDTYGPEFELGKAIGSRIGYSSWIDGRITIDPGREGGGSAVLEVCLLSEAMNALESDQQFMAFVS